MKPVERIIASAIIFSKDGKILMGKKDPTQSGPYSECWHIPGGGVESGESLQEAIVREVYEETGLDISRYELYQTPHQETIIIDKNKHLTLEPLLHQLEFNRFEVRLDQNADEIIINASSDLVILKWFSCEEIKHIEQIPGGREFFEKMGYLQ